MPLALARVVRHSSLHAGVGGRRETAAASFSDNITYHISRWCWCVSLVLVIGARSTRQPGQAVGRWPPPMSEVRRRGARGGGSRRCPSF
jgi:hypothetical protein